MRSRRELRGGYSFLTIQTDKINSSSEQTVGSNRSLERFERVGGVHFPPFLFRVLPTSMKDELRNLRDKILVRYAVRSLSCRREYEQSPEDAEASASLSVVVPVHDSPEVTSRCLKSLEKYAPKAEIILVDDGSKLEETRALLSECAVRNGWTLIRHEKSLGHSRACATGSNAATKPYLCLLNSDTVVTPWCWRPIVQALENDPTIGAAGPSSSNGGCQTLTVANIACDYLSDSNICEYARRLFAARSGNQLTDIPWLCGFALFTRRSFWEQIGGFDIDLVDYGNDYEISRRILEAGYRLAWVRNAYIHHFGHASYRKTIGMRSIESRSQAAHQYIKQKYGSDEVQAP